MRAREKLKAAIADEPSGTLTMLMLVIAAVIIVMAFALPAPAKIAAIAWIILP